MAVIFVLAALPASAAFRRWGASVPRHLSGLACAAVAHAGARPGTRHDMTTPH